MPRILEEESDSEPEFKTNNEYAKNYNTWRKKEELNKLKTKYGDDFENEDSSSESDDDEEGVELTEKVEKDFFKTLACLKNKDPKIYDENIKFFDDDVEAKSAKVQKDRKQPMYLKDYERNIILEKGGILSDEEDDAENRPTSPTYTEEQQQVKENLKKALSSVDEEDDDEWGGIFSKRTKTKEDTEKEEVEYKQWLAGQTNKLEDEEVKTELKPLKDYWNKPDLDEGEKFLKDYILKKRFLDKEGDEYIPSYEEIIHDSDQDFSNDEQTIEEQEEFEHKYNFRFEEPDQGFIKRYPRTMENSVRQKDDKRKVKRQEIKERKKKEKEDKMLDLKKLRELKRIEIEEKLEKLKEITGNTSLGFADEDIDGDFDPEKHDKRMQELFDEEFYEGPEGDQKPMFPDLDEELDIENYERFNIENDSEAGHAPHCEDEDFNMDCDYDPRESLRKEMIENSRGKKKRKRKSRFAEAVGKSKPKFDPSDKTYEAYFEEYYKLDCEDFVGDIPCRFKYRKVVPNDFGLSVEEILLAKERELNKWCSLKKAVQIRPDHIEKYDQIAYKKKSQNVELKKKILPSLFSEFEENPESLKDKQDSQENGEQGKCEESKETNGNINRKKNKKKKETVSSTVQETPDTNSSPGIESIVSEENAMKNEVKGKTKGSKRKKVTSKVEIGNTDEKTTESALSNGIISNETSASKSHRKRKKNPKDKVSKRKFKKVKYNEPTVPAISDERLSAYGIKPKKFKNKLKYKK